MHEHDEPGWKITIERNDSKVVVSRECPADELEYAVDDALRDARTAEGLLTVRADGAQL